MSVERNPIQPDAGDVSNGYAITTNNTQEPFDMVLVHGAWHSPAHWEPVAAQLRKANQQVIIPDLPAGDTTATFDDDTAIVEQDIVGRNRLFVVTHSRGFEVLPRLFSRIDKKRIIGALVLCSGGPHGVELPTDHPDAKLSRYNDMFLDGIIANTDDTTSYDPETARKVLFSEIQDNELLDSAAKALRPQRNPHYTNIAPTSLPADIPVHVRLGKHDAVLNNQRARSVFKHYANLNALILDFGHTPQLENPLAVSRLAVELANASATNGTR